MLDHRAEPISGRHTGYVVKVYPRFSETFVVTEILAREAAGEQLSIFALRPTTDARFHPELARVKAPVRHLPRATKLSAGWELLARAHRELPDFGSRFAALLPFTSRLEASEVLQGVALALAAQDEGVDHLHVHFASLQSRAARIASGLTGIPYSVTTHAKDLFHHDVDHELLDEVLTSAEAVIAISDYNLRHLTSTFPHITGHTHLVRNGLDLQAFGYTDPRPVAGALKVAAVGRLVEKKGFAVLVAAAAQAAATAGTSLEVRIAGEGELWHRLQTQISEAGLADTLTLIGPRSQEEIRELLDWADVLVAPCVVGADGNADGLPTVLLEAMASGVPCIATSVTGIPEAIHGAAAEGRATGILLPPGEVAPLARALTDVAAPAYPRAAVARAARAHVQAHFDTHRQSRLLAALQHRPVAVAS